MKIRGTSDNTVEKGASMKPSRDKIKATASDTLDILEELRDAQPEDPGSNIKARVVCLRVALGLTPFPGDEFSGQMLKPVTLCDPAAERDRLTAVVGSAEQERDEAVALFEQERAARLKAEGATAATSLAAASSEGGAMLRRVLNRIADMEILVSTDDDSIGARLDAVVLDIRDIAQALICDGGGMTSGRAAKAIRERHAGDGAAKEARLARAKARSES